METTPCRFEIRQARLDIDDLAAFLHILQSISREYSTHIVCFNADNMAGKQHAEAAIHYAQRSYMSEKPISNSFEMEALLFASGSRQCNTAAMFGIHEKENRIFICSFPLNNSVWEALANHMCFVKEIWDEISPEKEVRLKSFFGISQEELTLVGRTRIIDLVLERIALLEVNR